MPPDVTNTSTYHTLVHGLLKLIEHEAEYACLKAIATAINLHKENKYFHHIKSIDHHENKDTEDYTERKEHDDRL